MIPRRALATLVLLPVLAGCAARRPEVVGRTVSVACREGARVKGELLAVQDGQLLLRRADGVQPIPLSTVRDVRVKRHAWGGSRGVAWSVIGGLVSGAGLAASCSTVSSGCGGVGASVFALWLAVGSLSSLSMQAASQFRIAQPSAESLRPYARFPQGVPPGLDLAGLRPPAKQPGERPAGPPERQRGVRERR